MWVGSTRVAAVDVPGAALGSALGMVAAGGTEDGVMAVRPVPGCSPDFDGAVSVQVLPSTLDVVPLAACGSSGI